MNLGLFINIVLAVTACIFWKKGNKGLYLLIIQFMIFQSYRITTLMLSPIRSDDLALFIIVGTFLINYAKGKYNHIKYTKPIVYFCTFLIISFCVSVLIKGIPVIQAIKGVRGFFFVLIFYDIFIMKSEELKNSVYQIFILNIAISIIFIIQTFYPAFNILADDYKSGIRIGFLGLRRFYSYPALLPFACIYSIYLFPQTKKYKPLYIIISLFTLLLVQSRGMILYTVLLIIIASLMFKNKKGNNFIYYLISLIMIIVINYTIFSGKTGDKTTNDIELIMSGNINKENQPQGDATLAFRTWLLLNRNDRLIEGDIIDKIFGLGLFIQIPAQKAKELGISNIGNTFDNNLHEMFTPDISYANHLAFLGYVGTFLYLSIFINILKITYKFKKNNIYAKMGVLYILFLLFIGMNGSAITYSGCLIVPFIFFRLAYIEN